VEETSPSPSPNPKTLAEWQTYLAPHAINIKNFSAHTQATKTRLQIACMRCGTEERVLASNLIRRSLTSLCKNCGSRRDYTTENIRQILEAHGGELLEGDVKNKESVVRIRCACGAERVKRAQDVRRRPQSCDGCRTDLIRTTTLSKNDNLETARQIAAERGGRCLTEGADLVAKSDKLQWECSLGHTWTSQLSSVKDQETWCPHCDISFGENLTRALLEAAFEVPFEKQKPDFLRGLELDGYNPDLALAFETHGIQHYQRSPAFHRREIDLHAQIQNDIIKQIRCHKEKVTLISVPYFITGQGIDATRTFLARALEAAGRQPVRELTSVAIDMRSIFDKKTDPKFRAFSRIVQGRQGSFADKDYQGHSRPISVTCSQGHTWPAIPNLVIKGHWCRYCANVVKKDLATIEASLEKKGWSLREKPIYRNAHQLLPMQCSSGHEVDRTWNDWEQGHHSCSRCKKLAEARKFLVIMWMRGVTIDLDPDAYKSGKQEVEGTCTSCTGVSRMRIDRWKTIKKCPTCAMALPPYFKARVSKVDLVGKNPVRGKGESADIEQKGTDLAADLFPDID